MELVLENPIVTMNLSQYVDVQQGDGLDPAAPTYSEKVWARSLLKQGATLSYEQVKEREEVYPLKLHAANKTKLNELIEEINQLVRTTNCVLKWQDEGASEPTYFDVLSGQVDVEFNFRMGQQNWVPCRLRVFVKPYGRKTALISPEAQKTIVGGKATTTALGTMPLIVFNGASALAGDAPALIDGTVAMATEHSSEGMYAMSVLPAANFVPVLPAASATSLVGGSAIATVNAIAGSFYRIPLLGQLQWTLPAGATQYAMPLRALVVARVTKQLGLETYMVSNTNKGTVATMSIAEWGIVDGGIVRPDEKLLAAGEGTLVVNAAEGQLDVAGVILLPESSTIWLAESWPKLEIGSRDVMRFQGSVNEVRSSKTEARVGFNVLGYAQGAIPQVTPGPSPPTYALLFFGQEQPLNRPLTANVSVTPRARYVF